MKRGVLCFLTLLLCLPLISATVPVTTGYPFGGIYGKLDVYDVSGKLTSATPTLFNNPATGGQSCPSGGYTAYPFFGGGKGFADLFVCLGSSETMDMKYDFGGMYLKKGTSTDKDLFNPFTKTAGCPGYTDQMVTLMSRGGFLPAYELHVCYKSHVAGKPSSYFIGGIFSEGSIEDPGQSAAPKNTNGIMKGDIRPCPEGYVPSRWDFLQSIAKNAKDKDSYELNANLGFCWKPSDATGVSSESKTCSSGDQVLYSLFSPGDSHISEWNDSTAQYKICYDDVFPNTKYLGTNSHDCSVGNTNRLMQLKATANSHAAAQGASSVDFPIDICYGDIDSCTVRQDACSNNEFPVASFPSASQSVQGVHVAAPDYVAPSGAVQFSQKICCQKSVAPKILSVEWYDATTGSRYTTQGIDEKNPVIIQTSDETVVRGVRQFKIVVLTTPNLKDKTLGLTIRERDGSTTTDIASLKMVPIIESEESGTSVGKAEYLWTISEDEFIQGISAGEDVNSVFQYYIDAKVLETPAAVASSRDLYAQEYRSLEPRIILSWHNSLDKPIAPEDYVPPKSPYLLAPEGTPPASSTKFILSVSTRNILAGTKIKLTRLEQDTAGDTQMGSAIENLFIDGFGKAQYTWTFVDADFAAGAGIGDEDMSETPSPVLELVLKAIAPEMTTVPESTSGVLHVKRAEPHPTDNNWYCEGDATQASRAHLDEEGKKVIDWTDTREITLTPGLQGTVTNEWAAEACASAVNVPGGKCCPTGYSCRSPYNPATPSKGGCFIEGTHDCAWLEATNLNDCDENSQLAISAAREEAGLLGESDLCSGVDSSKPCYQKYCACYRPVDSVTHEQGKCVFKASTRKDAANPACMAQEDCAAGQTPHSCTQTITGGDSACVDGFRTVTQTNTKGGNCGPEVVCERPEEAIIVQVPCGASSVTLPFFGAWQALGSVIAIVILYVVLARSQVFRRFMGKAVKAHRKK